MSFQSVTEYLHILGTGQITQILIDDYIDTVKNPLETTEHFKDIQGNCELSVSLDSLPPITVSS